MAYDVTSRLMGDPAARVVRQPTEAERSRSFVPPERKLPSLRPVDRGHNRVADRRLETLKVNESIEGMTERQKSTAMHYFWRYNISAKSRKNKANGTYTVTRLA